MMMKKIMYDAQKFCVFTHFFVTLFTNFSSFIMFMRDESTINMMKHEKNMKKHENLWKTWKMREVVKNVWTMWKIMMYMIFHFFIVHQIFQLSQNFVKNEFFENFWFLQFFAFSKFLQVSSSTSSMMTSKVGIGERARARDSVSYQGCGSSGTVTHSRQSPPRQQNRAW